MPRWLGFLLLIGLLVFPHTAGAQGGTKLESLSIELWSEFDQPSMLVITEFVISEETQLPATVTMRFPREGNLIAVAVENNGQLFLTAFEGPQEQGNWQTVDVIVESRAPHRLEYYQPLTRQDNQRRFTYQWFGDYSVRQFDLTILIPADSTNLDTSPVLSSREVSANHLHLAGTVSRGKMKMGQSFEFDLSYERTSNTLTDPNQADQVRPSAPIDADTPGRVSVDRLPWLIGGMGLALIGIALWAYWRSVRRAEVAGSRPRPSKPRAANESGSPVYCHECGARAQPSDRFCRTCGSRLRAE